MKILQLIGNSAYGGATNIVIDISDALNKEFEVIIMANDKDTKIAFEKKGYKVYKIDSMCRDINPIKDIISIFKLKKFIKENKINIIHSHTSKGGAYSRLVKFIVKVKVIHTVHGFPFEYDNKIKNKMYRGIERFLSNISDYITFVNEKDYNYAKENYNNKKLRLTLNGVDEKCFSSRNKANEKLIIGIVARVVKQKGFDEFFMMVEKLQSNPSLNFQVLGTGPELEFYKNYALENNLNVDFLGFRNDVDSILSTWDIFVLPSWREGLPISTMEAMASSLPCVVTNIRGNNELVIDGVNGFLVNVKDYKDLTSKVKYLVDNEETRIKMGIEGRRIIEKKYTKKQMINNYMNIYNDFQN
ncbi:MAG: glycosyltransferase family 4 protein [Paeniclostridium sordellii]|uniref:glycosyltransferase family 4 protein n=1 Tax=Paraclostridium sordellii TaxID=1505 RepID=UPI0005E4051E|nr:glycosyltransferase family 4 protein [Paeniclostridium sordellii]MBS6025327.1 glycosyltransferase family 4 protein [Paeniclostridium sordellii]CEN94066.1 glycoside hydrolase [[Clostridium] sordellii] [Paeniclostridium sordellii]CEN96067.1 glycoside hydrolase [[Clostridium] sordellii] [Paeniclostridium sordellii]